MGLVDTRPLLVCRKEVGTLLASLCPVTLKHLGAPPDDSRCSQTRATGGPSSLLSTNMDRPLLTAMWTGILPIISPPGTARIARTMTLGMRGRAPVCSTYPCPRTTFRRRWSFPRRISKADRSAGSERPPAGTLCRVRGEPALPVRGGEP